MRQEPIVLRIPRWPDGVDSQLLARSARRLWKRLEPELWQPTKKTIVGKDIPMTTSTLLSTQEGMHNVENAPNYGKKDTKHARERKAIS